MDSNTNCEVCVQGHLSSNIWIDWLDDITVTNLEGQEALLAGKIADQATLVGLLNRLHALNIEILSIQYNGSNSSK